MRRLRVACVGGGFIAERHLRVLGQLEDVDVVAVADAVRDRAEAVAAAHGARAYVDGLDLLAEEQLDAVWLCVPPYAHGALELAAADRGLPFFVEKPLALDLETAVEVAEAVRDRRLLTSVGYHWRYLDVVQQAADVLRDAPPRLVLGYWLDATPPVPWWIRRDGSGGQVLEQTTHIFDLARLLVGDVDTVQALEVTTDRERFPGADVPTAATAMLRFRSGAIGTVSSSCVLDWRHRVGLNVVSEDAVVELVEQALSSHELRVVRPDGESVVRSRQDPTACEDREFVDVLLGRLEQVRVPYEEALRTHALAAAADRSAREGVPVTLG